ncbi:hypothetical protein [Desulfopila sp. IMCC35008]|uniref:hypothetical protein n=1 Tax=Desulfopila sp. IMCC35008 TaxID=2653858 RepID=UPI0013D6D847|nr:hypothetical protein [Desulfopila sp. IMCC35008]
MKRNSLLLLTAIALLSSCASLKGEPRVYIMQNPETMEFKNCDVGVIGLDKHFKDNEECVEKLKKEGWIVWGKR